MSRGAGISKQGMSPEDVLYGRLASSDTRSPSDEDLGDPDINQLLLLQALGEGQIKTTDHVHMLIQQRLDRSGVSAMKNFGKFRTVMISAAAEGWISSDDKTWQLTDKGRRVLELRGGS
jgi:hypothetical protein